MREISLPYRSRAHDGVNPESVEQRVRVLAKWRSLADFATSFTLEQEVPRHVEDPGSEAKDHGRTGGDVSG